MLNKLIDLTMNEDLKENCKKNVKTLAYIPNIWYFILENI